MKPQKGYFNNAFMSALSKRMVSKVMLTQLETMDCKLVWTHVEVHLESDVIYIQ